MSADAIDYVRDLGRDRITKAEKALLFWIADAYSDRHNSANLALESLCDEVLLERRWVQRLIKRLVKKGILFHKPGRGAGNFSEFRLPEFESERAATIQEPPTKKGGQKVAETWSKGGQKVVVSTTAIRKDLNQDLKRDSSPLLVPPLSAGHSLTVRDRRRLNEEIWLLMDKDPKTSLEEALRIACARLLLPLEAAQKAAILAGLEDAIKKPTARKPVQAAI